MGNRPTNVGEQTFIPRRRHDPDDIILDGRREMDAGRFIARRLNLGDREPRRDLCSLRHDLPLDQVEDLPFHRRSRKPNHNVQQKAVELGFG